MITEKQSQLLEQVNFQFVKLQKIATPQQLETFHLTWFYLSPEADSLREEQHLRSLKREQQLRKRQTESRF